MAGEAASDGKEAAPALSDEIMSGMAPNKPSEMQMSAGLGSEMPPLASLFGTSRSNSGETAPLSQSTAHNQAHAREHAEQVVPAPASLKDENSKSGLWQASHSQPAAERLKPVAVSSASDASCKQQPDKSKTSAQEDAPQRPWASPESAAPNTTDAVAEAIRAASAITEGTGISKTRSCVQEDASCSWQGSPIGLYCAEMNEELEGVIDASMREARLARMVDNLKRRLERLKAENEQLEEMLQQADAKVSGEPVLRSEWCRVHSLAHFIVSEAGLTVASLWQAEWGTSRGWKMLWLRPRRLRARREHS